MLLQGVMRMPGVEPGSQAWEACMMPLHYMRPLHIFFSSGRIQKNDALDTVGMTLSLCSLARLDWSAHWRELCVCVCVCVCARVCLCVCARACGCVHARVRRKGEPSTCIFLYLKITPRVCIVTPPLSLSLFHPVLKYA